VHYRFDSVQGADAHLTQLLVLKLYKEYTDSAFAVWVRHNVPDVASLLGGAAAVEAAAAAAAAAAAEAADGSSAAGGSLSTEGAKAVLQEVLAARKQVKGRYTLIPEPYLADRACTRLIRLVPWSGLYEPRRANCCVHLGPVICHMLQPACQAYWSSRGALPCDGVRHLS